MEWYEEPQAADALAQIAVSDDRPPAPKPGRRFGFDVGLVIGLVLAILAIIYGLI